VPTLARHSTTLPELRVRRGPGTTRSIVSRRDLAAGPTKIDWHLDEPGARANAGNGTTVTVL
jgi:hypothetical protein